MDDLHDCWTVSEPVIQRDIGRSKDIHIRGPQLEACQLIIYQSRISRNVRPVHVFRKETIALCCVFSNGWARTILEKEIFAGIQLFENRGCHDDRTIRQG